MIFISFVQCLGIYFLVQIVLTVLNSSSTSSDPFRITWEQTTHIYYHRLCQNSSPDQFSCDFNLRISYASIFPLHHPYHAQHYNTIIQNNNDSKFSKFLLGLKPMGWSTSAFIITLSSSLFSSKRSPKTGSNFSSLWLRPCLDDKAITCDFTLHRHEGSRVGNLHPLHLNINHGKPCKRSKCVSILCLWLCRCPDGQNKQEDYEGINIFETKPRQSICLHIRKVVIECILPAWFPSHNHDSHN